MKKLQVEDFIKITGGGCFCYCRSRRSIANINMLYVNEVENIDECYKVCDHQNESLPYYGMGDCYSGLFILDYPEFASPYLINVFKYINGGWKQKYNEEK